VRVLLTEIDGEDSVTIQATAGQNSQGGPAAGEAR
jgi:hypothetical protein